MDMPMHALAAELAKTIALDRGRPGIAPEIAAKWLERALALPREERTTIACHLAALSLRANRKLGPGAAVLNEQLRTIGHLLLGPTPSPARDRFESCPDRGRRSPTPRRSVPPPIPPTAAAEAESQKVRLSMLRRVCA
jgi:hypothetical protein